MYSSIFKYQKMLKNSKSKNTSTFKCLKLFVIQQIWQNLTCYISIVDMDLHCQDLPFYDDLTYESLKNDLSCKKRSIHITENGLKHFPVSKSDRIYVNLVKTFFLIKMPI